MRTSKTLNTSYNMQKEEGGGFGGLCWLIGWSSRWLFSGGCTGSKGAQRRK